MKKPAMRRHGIESLGMITFNQTRGMYPTKLEHEIPIDPVFQTCPQLLEFKCDEGKLKQMRLQEGKS